MTQRRNDDAWTAVKVSKDVARRGRGIRDLLLRKGDAILPKHLRGRVAIPRDPFEVAVRKFGVGQVLDLALAALEREIKP